MADSSNPPLFLHDGVYSAKLDRALIGGLLLASGDGNAVMKPRPGVRPHYVDDSNIESSMRVTVSGTTCSVLPGVAFVPGSTADGISGVYLVVNPTALPVPMPPASPVTQTGTVAVMVTDTLGNPPSDPAEGTWRIEYYTGTPPTGTFVLPLAAVTIPANGGAMPPPTDRRVFTTALGGALFVHNVSSLSSDPLRRLPFGSHAYVADTDMMYIRGKDGWVQNPAVATLSASGAHPPAYPTARHQNELLWNTATKTFYVSDSNRWVGIARQSSSVGTMRGTALKDGPATVATSGINMKITTSTTSWASINHSSISSYEPNTDKPDKEAFMLKVVAHSPNAPITVRVNATVIINKKEDNSYVEDRDNEFWIGVQIYTNASTFEEFDPTLPYPEPDDDSSSTNNIQEAQSVDETKTAMKWSTQWNKQNYFFEKADLPQGTYYIRPVFKTKNKGYFEVQGLFLEVSSR